MTTAPAPAARRSGALARGWRNFRRWRRGRPFWGGLLTMLAGIEIFFSGNLNLGELQLRVGLEGFQYYAISATLVLCGLLTWVTPAQRIFYGVLAALVAVYSLIGVNLGGFFIGMFLGIIGGSLSAAWVPVAPVEPARAVPDEPEPGDGSPEAEPAAEPATMDDLLSGRPRTGPLTDVLPAATTAPIPPQRPIAQTAPLQSDDPRWSADPGGGAEPRRSPPPFLSITMIPVTLAAAAVAVLPTPRAAQAAPCPPATTAPRPPAPKPPAPAPPPPSVAPSPTPSPSPTATDENGNPIQELIDGVGDFLGGLLGGGQQQQADPTPTPTPETSSPAPAPSPTASRGGGGASPAPARPGPTPCSTTSAPAPKPRQLAAAADQPPVAARPGRMTGSRVSMSGLSFDGVVSLPTVNPTVSIRALLFTMNSSTTNNFRLVTIDPAGRNVTLTSSALTVERSAEERVQFYTSRFTGKVFGLIELTFTPDSPPPLTLPEMFFTDPDIELVFVDCRTLLAPDLRVTTP